VCAYFRTIKLCLTLQFLDRQANHASLRCLQNADDFGRWYLADEILHRLANDIAERAQVIAVLKKHKATIDLTKG